MRKEIFIITISALLFTVAGYAQSTKLVKEGNSLYQQKKYKEASAAYQQAIIKNPNYTPGIFNLGNALYQQKQYEGARKVMDNAVKLDTNTFGKSAANYNIGNTYMAEQKWEEAVDAYKKALRTNPQDAEAKYNLSYAQQMLKKQGGGGKKNNKDDKKDDKNKDKQQNDQDKKKDDNKKDEQNKEQQNKDDKKDGEDKKPEPQSSKLSEKQAEQLLNALQQEEKKLQDKHKKVKGTPVKVDKDW